MKTGSANLSFLCNFSQLPQCLILACLLGVGGGPGGRVKPFYYAKRMTREGQGV